MNSEEYINLKFLVQLGETLSQALKMLRKCMDITSCCTHVFLNVTKGLKKAERRVKMTPGADGLQQA